MREPGIYRNFLPRSAFQAASGTTEVSRIYHLERGYEKMVAKLQGLGADIRKVRE